MKQTIRKSISLLLTLCMVLSLCTPALAAQAPVPEQAVAEERTTQMVEILPQEEEPDAEPPVQEAESDAELLQADADYVATFDTEADRGGWKKDSGPGSIAFTDGIGDAGFATISVGGNNSAFVAEDAPLLKDGFVEADITPIGISQQFALAFRYISASSYVAIGYDNTSKWNWCGNGGTPWGSEEAPLSTDHVPVAGTKLHLRIEYVEERVRVLVDGEEIFYGVLPSGTGNNSTDTLPTGAGKCGFRTWGSGNNNSVKIDNVRMGALSEIVPTQHAVTVVNGTANPTTAAMGTKVTITANDPEGEAAFGSWTSSDGIVFDDAVNPTTTFTMPAKAVTVTATYNKPGAEGGLVLHSTFDAGDRTATEIKNLADETHMGTINGTVTFEAGVRGDAVKIYEGPGSATPTKNYVDYGTKFDAMMGTENFSVAVWIKSESATQEDRAVLGNKMWANGNNKGFTIPFIHSSIEPNFGTGSNRVDNKGIGGLDAKWHHVVVTVDRDGSMVSYLDGQLAGTSSMSALKNKNATTGLPFILGADGAKQYNANSTLDELRIYDRALTKEEATNIFTMDGGALIELGRLEDAVNSIEPSDHITAEAIAAFKVVLSEAKAELETLTDTAEILALIANLQAQYDTLLEGTGHLAKFVAFSDVHSGDVAARNQKFVKAMEDMKDVAPDAIAMLNGGDFGESTESAHKGFFKTMEDNCPYEDEKVLVALGNHDVRVNGDSWHSNPDYPGDFKEWPTIKARYLELNAPYMPEGNDEVYFSKKLGGYTFIVLNTELGLKDDMYMSDAQVAWFEATMKAAYEEDASKPVFILGHQALGETHWPNPKEYPFSPQNINADAQVKEIMRKYPVGTFLSGHLHNGLGYSQMVNTDYGALIDVPSLLQPEGRGYSQEGAGFVAYIYKDEVLWRARNFLTKEWLPEYDITVKTSEMPKLSATVEDDETGVTYSTGTGKAWTREAPYHTANLAWPTTAETQYPSVTLTFDGTGITLYGHKIANGATMSVTVDGEETGTADFYAPTVMYNADSKRPVPGLYGIQASAKVFEVSGLERGEHTVVLTMTNTKNDAAQPKDGMLRAAIDYAKINYAKGYPAGTTFYVDSEGGSDSNEGTSAAAPWNTLEKVNALTLKPGDRVLLKAGSVFEGQSLSLRGSGSKEKPILVDMYNGATVGAEAGAKPHIKANGVAKAPFTMGNEGNTATTSYPAIAYGMHIKNMSYITVKNLEITNNNGQAKTVDKVNGRFLVGVIVEAESGQGVVSGIHLDGLNVHDVNGDKQQKTAPNGGIYFITTAASGDVTHPTRYDDISVQNCTVADVSRTGISVGSSHSAHWWEGYKIANGHPSGIIPEQVKTDFGHTNVLIKNNFVQNAGGDAIVPQFCVAPLIEYNISDSASQNSGSDGNQFNAGIWPWRCEDALFQFNEAYKTKNNGDGQAYDCDSSRGTTYQYNYSHDNGGGFILLCQEQSVQSTVRYNISQNDLNRLFLLSNTEPAEIYNNTFYLGEGLSTRIMEGSTPSNLKNNIFYTEGTNKNPSWGRFTYTNNLFYGFENAPTGNGNITVDPMFVDPGKGGSGVAGNSAIDTLGGYALKAGSPAIDAGVPITENGGRDYAGNPIVGNPDIGAMEFTPATGVTLDRTSAELYSNAEPKTVTLTATMKPAGASNQAVSWTSDNEAVATVDANGVVTAVANGTATITVTTADGGHTATCTVTVSTYTEPYNPPSSSNTTTKTEKNPDGSTTKTVTDKKTGKVTATTTYPDGTKIVTTTPKDGETSIEVTVPKGKDSVTVTIPTDKKPAPGEVVAIIREDSTREIIRTSVSTEDGLRVALTENAKLEIVDNSKSFADVAGSHWAHDAVQFAASRELFNGTGKDSFSPAADMSRAMLVTVLARLDGQDTAKGDTWDAVGMAWAKENDISDGTGLEQAVSREQLAVMLYRYAKAEKLDADLTDFSDAGSVSPWAAEAMNWAVKSGIITGKNGALDPQGNASRAEVATMLQRFASLLVK